MDLYTLVPTLGCVIILFIAFFFYNKYYINLSVKQKFEENENELAKKIDGLFEKYMGGVSKKKKKKVKEDSVDDPMIEDTQTNVKDE